MELVTTAELIELYQASTGMVDAQDQYWLSITFAVIVTSYLAGDKLSIKLRAVIVFLYLLTSSLFVWRYLTGAAQIGYLAVELHSRLPDWPFPDGKLGVLHRLTFFFGIFTTLWFVLFQKLTNADKK